MRNTLVIALAALLGLSMLSASCNWVGRTAGKTQAKVERKVDSIEDGYHQGYEQEKAKTEKSGKSSD